jgi:hypothetical protein
VFGLSGKEFLSTLRAAMLRRGPSPMARLLGLWDGLEALFQREDFGGSFPVRAAIAVHTEPGQPVPAVVVQHHQAVRGMLEELVCVGERSPGHRLAAQLELLVEGAIAGAAIDQEPTAMQAARELSLLAIAIHGLSPEATPAG